ncbi:hypothetical protein QBC40DRAFT_312562 [Triangularia verruculosa]|uniref:Uncharacterized protein n=1 Tax=Triangularia verruculosa TaxID=2587418 RepID=A0AAN7ARW4_9PEZI|nr:hypothetical protein QBC40DRAFT_312562 [Triangularia verruculosa]
MWTWLPPFDNNNNATGNLTAAWHPEPAFRGTWGILYTCLITLGLCVWTSVHVNIDGLPAGGQQSRKWWNPLGWTTWQQRRKLGCMVFAFFAPEIVAFTAWEQWKMAKKATASMNEVIGECFSNGSDTRAPEQRERSDDIEMMPKSMKRSASSGSNGTSFHTAASENASNGPIMQQEPGGTETPEETRHRATSNSVPEASHTAPTRPPTRPPTWTIAHGFFLQMGRDSRATPELLPIIRDEDISDKSKAAGLAKTLTCTQAVWFITQCTYRLVTNGHSISVLELNTLCHAILALISYYFWWHKPYDVEQPIKINLQSKRSRGLCAWMYMTSIGELPIGDQYCPWHPSPMRYGFRPPNIEPGTNVPIPEFFDAASNDERRWKLAYRFITKYSYNVDGGRRYRADSSTSYMPIVGETYDPSWASLRSRNQNRPMALFLEMRGLDDYDKIQPEILLKKEQNIAFLVLLLFSLLYSVPHILVWDFPGVPEEATFHTPLWRVAGLALAATVPLLLSAVWVWGFILLVANVHTHGIWSLRRVESGSQTSSSSESTRSESTPDVFELLACICTCLALVTSIGLFVAQIGGRIVLMGEAFVMLPYSQDSVFQQPVWAHYFPHFG